MCIKIISEINTQVSVLWQEVVEGFICLQKDDLSWEQLQG